MTRQVTSIELSLSETGGQRAPSELSKYAACEDVVTVATVAITQFLRRQAPVKESS